jgi:hypothetical protein
MTDRQPPNKSGVTAQLKFTSQNAKASLLCLIEYRPIGGSSDHVGVIGICGCQFGAQCMRNRFARRAGEIKVSDA